MKVINPPISVISKITIDSDIDMLSTYQVKALASPASTEALRKGSQDITNAEIADAADIALSKLESFSKSVGVLKTADETVNNSDALQDDDHLKWTVAANEVWRFYMALKITTGSTPGFKLLFTVPTGGALIGWTAGDIGLLTNLASGLTGRDLTAFLAIAGAKTDVWLVIWGQYIGGANAGTVQLQWAQGVANASDTIVRKNSFILAHKLG